MAEAPPTLPTTRPGARAAAAAGFRWRGHEISRVEGFTDAVFAFAVTLLVVSLEVPRTFRELAEAMDGFVAFALGFTLLFWIWYQQYVFFRRYGMQDTWTITLNGTLVFVVLFFVYPLKFLFVNLVKEISGRDTRVLLADGALHQPIGPAEAPALLIIYGAGYVAIFTMFFLLYGHALQRRGDLGLTQLELFDTRSSLREACINMGVGVVSILLACVLPVRVAGIAGWVYASLGPLMAVHGSMRGRARRRLQAGG